MASNKIPARPMEYPYTFTSKITHFPYRTYWEHGNWRIKWAVIGFIVSTPIFYKMHKALNSPANYEKLKQVRAKEHQEYLDHLAHLK